MKDRQHVHQGQRARAGGMTMGGNAEPASGDAPSSSISRFEIGLIVTLVAVWIPGLLQLAEVWRNVEYASHGFPIPAVALWAATARRAELATLPKKPGRDGRGDASDRRAPTLLSVEFAATGPLHEWAGVATYVIGCLALLGVGALMRRFVRDDVMGSLA